jgi:hypothetical protein
MHTLNAEYWELLFEKRRQTPAFDAKLSKTPIHVDVIFKLSQQNGIDFEIYRTLKVVNILIEHRPGKRWGFIKIFVDSVIGRPESNLWRLFRQWSLYMCDIVDPSFTVR